MRFAIIGCGTIAQIMHIPYVTEIPDAEVHALVDPADDRLETVADRYNVPNRFASVDELVESIGDEIDAAIVLTPPQAHAETATTTLRAGIHTLVEKPLAVSLEDATQMVDVARESDVTAMVAYMKRYDPAYEEAKSLVDDVEQVDLITAYDVDPDHGRIIDEVYDIVGGEVPDSLVAESQRKREADAKQVLDTDDDALAADYNWHLEHVCHDVNVLRGLFGDVTSIDHVDLFADGRYATAQLRYEGDRRCELTSGLSERKWFEEYVRIDTPESMLNLEFSNPYIRNTPTELQVKQGTDEVSDDRREPSYEESFKRELEYFVDCVRGERSVRTTFEEAREDVRLIANLFRTYEGTDVLDASADASESA